MMMSIALNYCVGLAVERHRNRPSVRWILAAGVAANLLLLGVFKYANFLVDNLNQILAPFGISAFHIEPVHLPIGLSFFTFQAISYVVDVYRNRAPARHNPIHVALYISLFPQLIAGPIVRYHQIARELVERTVTAEGFTIGVRRFTIGLGKKVLIANPLGAVATQIFDLPSNEWTAGVAWLAIVCYTLQIYFDFSGYSDMAIGLGRMFGFHFPENFNYPYVARSVREFWRRWHISLSTWFRDYLYIPLGGSRVGTGRTAFNLVLVFFLCGLWHGASWNFVIWGLLHGTFLGVERTAFGPWLDRQWRPIRHAYTLGVVVLAWVFFRVDRLPDALTFLSALAGFGHGSAAVWNAERYLTGHVIAMLIVGVIAATPVVPAIVSRLQHAQTALPFAAPAPRLALDVADAALFLILLASVSSLAAGTFNPFIYFRF